MEAKHKYMMYSTARGDSMAGSRNLRDFDTRLLTI
jgi:hypothetical protein